MKKMNSFDSILMSNMIFLIFIGVAQQLTDGFCVLKRNESCKCKIFVITIKANAFDLTIFLFFGITIFHLLFLL
jgi:hypothetical protein